MHSKREKTTTVGWVCSKCLRVWTMNTQWCRYCGATKQIPCTIASDIDIVIERDQVKRYIGGVAMEVTSKWPIVNIKTKAQI